jgi:zinc protease
MRCGPCRNPLRPDPANPDIDRRTRPQEPPQIADRRLIYEDERVANPYVARAYYAPARAGRPAAAAALTLLAEILGGSGQTSVLAGSLQVEEERALFSAAFYDSTSYDASSFNLVNVPRPRRISLEEAEADLDRTIAQFLQDGIDPAQFERIKFQIEASQIFEEDNVQGLARGYGVALTSGLTVDDVEAWPDVLASVTIDEVMAEARRLFTETRSVTGYLMQPAIETTAQEVSAMIPRILGLLTAPSCCFPPPPAPSTSRRSPPPAGSRHGWSKTAPSPSSPSRSGSTAARRSTRPASVARST